MNQGLEPAETFMVKHTVFYPHCVGKTHTLEWFIFQDQIFMWNVQQYKKVSQPPEKISSQS